MLSACFQSERLYTAGDTLISEKHKSISGRNTVSHPPSYSFPLSAHLKGLIVALNMAMLGLKENMTFSEKTLIGWRRVKKLNRLYLFHMLCVKAEKTACNILFLEYLRLYAAMFMFVSLAVLKYA